MSPLAGLRLVLGVIMTGLALFIAARPLIGLAPLSQRLWLDVVFAAFFALRGAMLIRQAVRRTAG